MNKFSPQSPFSDDPQFLACRPLAEVEQELILNTLTACNGNRTQTADILGISIRTLRNKLRLYLDRGVAVTPPWNGGTTDQNA